MPPPFVDCNHPPTIDVMSGIQTYRRQKESGPQLHAPRYQATKCTRLYMHTARGPDGSGYRHDVTFMQMKAPKLKRIQLEK